MNAPAAQLAATDGGLEQEVENCVLIILHDILVTG